MTRTYTIKVTKVASEDCQDIIDAIEKAGWIAEKEHDGWLED